MAAIRAVFFDLDGTLIDTAPDMGRALNQLLQNHNRAGRSPAEIRPHVSNGTQALIELGFGELPDAATTARLRREYLQLYSAQLTDQSQLFPGMADTIAAIETRKLPWGVITNKPGWLTEPLLRQLHLRDRCACAVSADTCERRKPHPMPMYHACRLVGVAPEHCIYVGDALRDIQAGNAAGMKTVAASYGYLCPHSMVAEWQADAIIDTPADLLGLIDTK